MILLPDKTKVMVKAICDSMNHSERDLVSNMIFAVKGAIKQLEISALKINLFFIFIPIKSVIQYILSM